MRCTAFVFGALLCVGCASVPKGRYGVESVKLSGVDQLSEEALQACLATREREANHLRLGLGSSSCGDPPFDEDAPDVKVFSWPWDEWPVFDSAIFDVDQRRIERWYQARGYYDAKVVNTWLDADGEPVSIGDQCTTDSCELDVHVMIEEGKPVYVARVIVEMPPELDPALKKRLLDSPELTVGWRFDEAIYESDKERLSEMLKEKAFAKAIVDGVVELDRHKRVATVRYRLKPGPACVIGSVRVEGEGELDAAVIQEVAGLKPGVPFQQSALTDAELAVFALGALSTVHVEMVPRADREDIVDLVIRVTPGRASHWRLGIGVMSGSLQRATSDETFSVPQWDVHLKAAYRDDNFLGGLRRFNLEERPRLIFLREFPELPDDGPRLGNTIIAGFEQPSFIEHRTVLFIDAQWDIGPDAFYGYFRHDIGTKIGLRRAFFAQKLIAEASIGHDLYEIIETPPPTASSYRLPFFEQQLTLDLRNDAVRPSKGLYVSTAVQEAVQLGYGSWDYVRVTPEVRGYLKLPLRIVLAQKFALGWLFILDSDPALDPVSEEVGPQTYRLRGGGANSNRGFGPGELGVGIDGGTRRWESSTEARLPLSADFTLALFFDMGDVSRGKRIRFEHVNASTGFGLRYHLSFATIRLDAGWQIPGWQRVGGNDAPVKVEVLPSALHLTLGEAF